MLSTENYYLQEQAKRMPEVDQELYFVIEEKNNGMVEIKNKIKLQKDHLQDMVFKRQMIQTITLRIK